MPVHNIPLNEILLPWEQQHLAPIGHHADRLHFWFEESLMYISTIMAPQSSGFYHSQQIQGFFHWRHLYWKKKKQFTSKDIADL